jgi:hypothetical protein
VTGKRQREENDTDATATVTDASSWTILKRLKAVSSFIFAKLTPMQQQ